MLELLAVCERAGLTDLEQLYGAEILEALEASRLVTVVTAGRRTAVRLAHPLYGEVLRERLPPLRLRRIHQQLADVVEAHGARRREDVVQVALWRVASGGRVPGTQLLRAARLALVGHDPALAVRLVTAAPEDGTVTAGERGEVLAEAHAMQGHDDDVERGRRRRVGGAPDRGPARPVGAPSRRHPLLPSTRPRGRARRPRGGAATAHRSGVHRRDRRPAGDAAGRGGATGRSAADRRDGGRRRRHGGDAGRTCRGHGHQPRCSSDGSTRPSPCLARLPSSRPACRAGSPGGGSPCTSSTKPMPWPTAVGTRRLGTCSCRQPNGPARRTPPAPGCGSRWCSPRSPVTPAGRARRSVASLPSPRRRRRLGRMPRSSGPTSAWRRGTCCSASTGWRPRPCSAPTTSGEARSPRRSPRASEQQPGSTPAAVTWRRPGSASARSCGWLDATRSTCSSSARSATWCGSARRTKPSTACGSWPVRSTGRSSRPTPRGPRRWCGRDVDLLGDVVDRYERIDVLGHAAEVAAELAELRRSRGESQAGDRGPAAICRAGRPGRRDPHAGPRPWHRRRAADTAGARGRPPGGRRPHAAATSANACTCRRAPSTPISHGCIASSGSPAAASSPPPSARPRRRCQGLWRSPSEIGRPQR